MSFFLSLTYKEYLLSKINIKYLKKKLISYLAILL
jgi:hypothetical protein